MMLIKVRCVKSSARSLLFALEFVALSTVSANSQDHQIDPILRHLPLEDGRREPKEARDPHIRVLPGRQTVVMRATSSIASAPVVIHIPSSFFVSAGPAPIETSHIFFVLQYPAMTRYIERINSCRGWCEGKMILAMQYQSASNSVAALRVTSILRDIERQKQFPEPLIEYKPISPAGGYDEAIEINFSKDASRQKAVYWKRNEQGSVEEFAQCSLRKPSPSCEFFLSFPNAPRLGVTYTLSANYWPERVKVREAVLSLVRSFVIEGQH